MFWETYVSTEMLSEIGISLGILLLFLLFRKIFTKYIFQIILRLSKKTPTQIFSHVLLSFEKPVRWLFVIIGIYVAVRYFPYIDHTNPMFMKLIRASVIILLSWGLYNVSSASSAIFHKLNEKTSIEIDQLLIPILSKAIRFVIIAISITIIAQEFEYDVNGFIAGLGLGGLAIALAAQDAVKNLFGGFVIITEKPFSIGDWIMTPSVEGTVENITFRSTLVRTFAQALVTVPNSVLANETITNWSKMGKRRITFNLRITYDTPKEKVDKVAKRIKDYLRNNPAIHQETIFVTFDTFNESSLDLFLYFFTKTTVWGEYLDIKHEVNLKIMEILEEEEVRVALPARSLHVAADEEEELERLKLTEK